MVSYYSQASIQKFITKYYDMIDCAKVTSVKEYGFNSMEGYTYIGVIKFILKNGRYKLVRTEFNSTYLDDEDTPEDYLERVLEGMFNAVE